MTYLVSPNSVSLQSDNYSFLMNINGPKKDRHIVIFSNTIELPPKVLFPANIFYAAGHFYDNKLSKFSGK